MLHTTKEILIAEFLTNLSDCIAQGQSPIAMITVNEDGTSNFGVNPLVEDEDLLVVLQELVETTKMRVELNKSKLN